MAIGRFDRRVCCAIRAYAGSALSLIDTVREEFCETEMVCDRNSRGTDGGTLFAAVLGMIETVLHCSTVDTTDAVIRSMASTQVGVTVSTAFGAIVAVFDLIQVVAEVDTFTTWAGTGLGLTVCLSNASAKVVLCNESVGTACSLFD